MLRIWYNSLSLASRSKQEACGVSCGGGKCKLKKKVSNKTKDERNTSCENDVHYILINDNNMKIKINSLRWKQFIFMACVLQKTLQL